MNSKGCKSLLRSDSVQIKFCGLRTKYDIVICQDADYLGFIVEVPEAERSLSLEKAARLIKYGKKFALTVAVITALEKIPEICEFVRPDIIQIHTAINCNSNTLQEKLASFKQKYALTIGLESKRIVNYSVLTHDLGSKAEYIVIEASKNGKIEGGQGNTRDWDKTTEIIRQYPNFGFFVAGGLNPTNVSKIISITRPTGIDISSGIENSKGIKSPVLVQKIINQVRNKFVI